MFASTNKHFSNRVIWFPRARYSSWEVRRMNELKPLGNSAGLEIPGVRSGHDAGRAAALNRRMRLIPDTQAPELSGYCHHASWLVRLNISRTSGAQEEACP